MIQLVGFSGPDAHSVIYWSLNGIQRSKTICYSRDEEQDALNRFHTSGDFYSFYDQATVVDQDGQTQNYHQVYDMQAI